MPLSIEDKLYVERAIGALESLAVSFGMIATQFVKQSELTIKVQAESLAMERERLATFQKQQAQFAGLAGALGEANAISAQGVEHQKAFTESHQKLVDAAVPPKEPWQDA